MRKFIVLIILIFTLFQGFAQGNQQVEMADLMRSNGKIYTVVAVCLTILFGLIGYLIHIERRLAKWEKTNNH
jgi:hypothetical protein